MNTHTQDLHKPIVTQILELKESDTIPTERGRDFENLIREFPIWDTKPDYRPRSRQTKIDQLDAFFTSNGVSFLIEAKAIKKPLTAGSNDWKSYKDKMSIRSKLGVIGIFASLYPVDNGLIENATLLNQTGIHNFVLAGDFWEQLSKSKLEFKDILEHMVHEVRVNQKSLPSDLRIIEKRLIDKADVKNKILLKVKRLNSEFLNRFEHDKHDDIYVERTIDSRLKKNIQLLRPSRLEKNTANPFQLHLIRDNSGAGKTTFSVNLSRLEDYCIPLIISASSDGFDKEINRLLGDEEIGGFLKSTIIIDQPLVLIIDSLDEVKNIASKSIELKALFRTIDSHNVLAKKEGYAKFPILVYFTVRDEYFDQWGAYFDGRAYSSYRKKITAFNSNELDLALSKYGEAYKYAVVNFDALDSTSKDVLSLPINLEIFSNANKNLGRIKINEVWENKILHDFFLQKNKSLSKRNLGTTHEEYFFPLLTEVATHMLSKSQDTIHQDDFERLIIKLDPRLRFYSGQFWIGLVSEHVFSFDNEDSNTVIFRYKRIWEYLIARKISQLIKRNEGISNANDLVKSCLEIPALSIYRIMDNLDFLVSKLEIPDARFDIFKAEIVSDEGFIHKHLIHQRYLISIGEKTKPDSLRLVILGASLIGSGRVVWDAFFILAAKRNNSSEEQVLEFFDLAWKHNNLNRYKLIIKISALGYLTSETVLLKLMYCSDPIIWEVFLGECIKLSTYRDEFIQLYHDLDIAKKVKQQKIISSQEDWNHVDYLIKTVLEETEYVPGITGLIKNDFNKIADEEVFRDEVFNSLKMQFDECYSLKFMRTGTGIRSLVLSIKERTSLVEYVRKVCQGDGMLDQTTLFDYLVSSLNSGALKFLFDLNLIDLKKSNIETFLKSISELHDNLIVDVVSSGFYELQKHKALIVSKCISFLESTDDPYVKGRALLISLSVQLENESEVLRMFEMEKQILTLESIKLGIPIGNKLSNLLATVNNAITHYKEYLPYFYAACKVYGRHDELLKRESYRKKYDEFISSDSYSIDEHDPIIEKLFPELAA